MNDIGELKERYNQIYPAFGSYTECMSRALLTGLSASVFGFSSSYFAHYLLRKRIPYGIKGHILVSSGIAIAISYKVTSDRTKACQKAWMAAEDKHTYLQPIEKKSDS